MQNKNTENQNTKNEINEGEQNGMDFLKTQNEITVIDIPEQQTREAENTKKKDKFKHVLIYKQFFILRVYTTAIMAFAIYFILNIVYNIADTAIFGERKEDSTNQEKLEEELKKLTVPMILYVCIFGPVLEEFIFRSIIFKSINWAGKMVHEKSKALGNTIRVLAFLISSFVFAFGHFAFKFGVLIDEIRTFPPYFIMGLVLAYAYNRDNYLLASIYTHIINNTFATLIIFFVKKEIGIITFSSMIKYVLSYLSIY